MLSIQPKLPIKRMALYGSLAVLVGFTGTYAVLNELVPNDDPDLAGNTRTDVENASVSNQVPKDSKKSTDTAKAGQELDENGIVVRSNEVPSQQTLPTSSAPRTSVNTPTATTSPILSTAPSMSGGSSGGGGSTTTITSPSPTPTVTQPAPTTSPTQPSSPLPSTSDLQKTVNGTLDTATNKLLP